MSTSTRVQTTTTDEPACNGHATNGHAKTSSDSNGLIIENPAHPLTTEVSDAFNALRTSRLNALAIDNEPILNREMREQSAEMRLRTLRTFVGANHDFDALKNELRDGALKRSTQISRALQDRARRKRSLADLFKLSDQVGVIPKPTDHSFWWAQTDTTLAHGMQSQFLNDGLHFSGMCKVDDYDGSINANFGAIAKFALQVDRFPTAPPSGMFSSSPHIELFGGISAYAPEWDLVQGDGIAECSLMLRQTILQWRFGQDGPVAHIVKEKRAFDVAKVRLVNTGYAQRVSMPGFLALPTVVYEVRKVLPNELWAEIEVNFAIHLNCTGASVMCDPDVLLRTFQWAPEAV